MAILIHTQPMPPQPFAEALQRLLPDELLLHDLDTARRHAAQVDTVLLWRLAPGLVGEFPNLKFLAASAAGVDKILPCPDLPPTLPVTRTVDPAQNLQIAQFICAAVLRQQRQQALYDAQQRDRLWKRHPIPDPAGTRVGLLGLGESGTVCARALLALGYTVLGWSRTERKVDGVQAFHGDTGLRQMLPQCQFLVCLLPLTPSTQGLINAALLAQLPRGAYVVNVARGGHVVEADLISAVESGQLSGAALDVQGTEPLPPDDPLWAVPGITLTPHIASQPSPETVATQLAENLHRSRSGQSLLRVACRERGY